MKKEEVIFSDWHRWLFGTAPPAFTGEVAIRAFIIFTVMLLIVRLLGRRMKGQLSVSELAVVLTLGAIIAGPTQIPTAGLLPTVVVLVAVLGMHRLSNWLAFKYRRVELWQQGDLAVLVRNGCMEMETLQLHAISQDQLFGLLRNEKIAQLGELKRVYMEANGRVSCYKRSEPQPGLSLLPRAAAAPASTDAASGPQVCATCGRVAKTPADRTDTHCPHCGADNWQPTTLA
ncbi:DUF421 domain-containing protein [Hymenobacter bucti]|uniref:DUF421 domain-containing protein n=1 Tax=Hymenobacter bucti TaxID=1844114 RepID=A0ABW4QUP0_9BACT